MQNNKNAENIVVVIIAVFIFSFTLFWIVNIFSFHFDIHNLYKEDLKQYQLHENIKKISQKLDLSDIAENEDFYIYKNTSSNNFEVFTGAINNSYSYINTLGELSENTLENLTNTYAHSITKIPSIFSERNEILNTADIQIYLTALNIDGTGNSTLSADQPVATWQDLSENNIIISEWSTAQQPVFHEESHLWFPMLDFDGVNDRYTHTITHTGWIEKTIHTVFQTGDNITLEQTIYDEWDSGGWYRIYIENGTLLFKLYDGWTHAVSMPGILPNSTYFITGVQDASSGDPSLNTLTLYHNGSFIESINNIGTVGVYNDIWIGRWLTGWWSFEWMIGSLLVYNRALNEFQLNRLHSFIGQEWSWEYEDYHMNQLTVDIEPITGE